MSEGLSSPPVHAPRHVQTPDPPYLAHSRLPTPLFLPNNHTSVSVPEEESANKEYNISTSAKTGNEEREQMFGRMFGLMALSRSNMMEFPQSLAIIHHLLELSKKKRYATATPDCPRATPASCIPNLSQPPCSCVSICNACVSTVSV